MHLLDADGADLPDARLAELYAFPAGPWVRANFVSTLDGAATGADHRTNSINNEPDNRVFALQRRLCDAILVGAGTVRAEQYRRVVREDGWAPTLVIVSHQGRLPETIDPADDEHGDVIFITREGVPDAVLNEARGRVGAVNVWALGHEEVDLGAALNRLHSEGFDHILAEGGPTLFAHLLSAGLVDEVALTLVPTLVGGALTRITEGGTLDVRLGLHALLEQDGTLLGLWRVQRPLE